MSDFLSRRSFINKAYHICKTLAAGTLFYPLFSFRTQDKSKNDSVDLAVIKGNPEKSVAKAFELLGGIEKYIRPNNIVLLKPNVCLPNPRTWGTTTSPEVVRSVAQLALNAGAKRIIVADNTLRNSDICFKKTGLQESLQDLKKVKIISLHKENFYEQVTVQDGIALKTLKIAKLVRKSDVLINLPCAKSHVATQISFGLKNLMGLIWDRTYFHDSTDLHTAIAELALTIRPQITIMDATRALLTGGPTGPGKVLELNTIIAGTDPLAVDAFTATLSNWNNQSISARTVNHLVHASKLGVGQIDLENLVIRELTV